MSNTHLILSSNQPWDATYRTQGGQVIYKVESSWPGRDITISKVMPSFGNQIPSFAHLATVEYHMFSSDRIRMGNLNVATNDYFRKENWWSQRNYIFMGSDGREYLWRLGRNNCKLFLNDSAKTPVARFYSRQLGIIGKSRPASLEIYAVGNNMVDLIVVTGVYMEKQRRKQKERTEQAIAAGAGGGT